MVVANAPPPLSVRVPSSLEGLPSWSFPGFIELILNAVLLKCPHIVYFADEMTLALVIFILHVVTFAHMITCSVDICPYCVGVALYRNPSTCHLGSVNPWWTGRDITGWVKH